MYMATEEILTGVQLVPNANIVINPIGVTNRIGDGLKNAVTQINGLAETVSNQSQQIDNVKAGIAIIVNGDTATQEVPAGGYAYIKNNTHELTEGLYRNKTTGAFPVTGGTADSTIFESVSNGGLNDLNNKFVNRPKLFSIQGSGSQTVDLTSYNLSNPEVVVSPQSSDQYIILAQGSIISNVLHVNIYYWAGSQWLGTNSVWTAFITSD